MAWAALWQNGDPVRLDGFSSFRGSVTTPLDALTFCLEVAMPRKRRFPLRLWQGGGDSGTGGGLALYWMPDGSLRALHGSALDVETPPGFLEPGHVLVLRIVICATGRCDVFDVLNADTGKRHRLRHGIGSPPKLADALPISPGFVEMARMVGIATHALTTTDLPGLESGAMVGTPDGPVPVEHITQGSRVTAEDGSVHVVRWTDTRERLCMGRFAPILLRSPYFGLGADTCVTPETRLMRHGADVEYLAGIDTVLVRAADLVSGPAARFERSQPIRRFHHIMLDDPICLNVWRCKIETAFLAEVLASEDAGSMGARPDAKDCAPSLPLLDRSAARALLARGVGAQSFVV